MRMLTPYRLVNSISVFKELRGGSPRKTTVVGLSNDEIKTTAAFLEAASYVTETQKFCQEVFIAIAEGGEGGPV